MAVNRSRTHGFTTVELVIAITFIALATAMALRWLSAGTEKVDAEAYLAHIVRLGERVRTVLSPYQGFSEVGATLTGASLRNRGIIPREITRPSPATAPVAGPQGSVATVAMARIQTGVTFDDTWLITFQLPSTDDVTVQSGWCRSYVARLMTAFDVVRIAGTELKGPNTGVLPVNLVRDEVLEVCTGENAVTLDVGLMN
ncbi:MAG: hypothetical protein E6Q44_13345 [Flavobacteriales bacterium]|jgi:type II secretory pathway pseudopilin PulG|nr:MAG: hypothetical protein E6Q44_13345 [Flavobacteriales bacterium]